MSVMNKIFWEDIFRYLDFKSICVNISVNKMLNTFSNKLSIFIRFFNNKFTSVAEYKKYYQRIIDDRYVLTHDTTFYSNKKISSIISIGNELFFSYVVNSHSIGNQNYLELAKLKVGNEPCNEPPNEAHMIKKKTKHSLTDSRIYFVKI